MVGRRAALRCHRPLSANAPLEGQCEVGPTSPCGEKGLRDRTGVEQWQGSWSVPYRRESDTPPCRWSCSMGMTSAEHLQRPLPTTKQPVPLTARQAVLRWILFVRGGLYVGGLYRSAVGRMRSRDSKKNTPRPKFWMYCIYFQNLEGGAIRLHTPWG